MDITEKEAETIICLASIVWGESLGAEGDKELIRRIVTEYPNQFDKVIESQLVFLETHDLNEKTGCWKLSKEADNGQTLSPL